MFLLGSDEFGRDWYSRLCHNHNHALFRARTPRSIIARVSEGHALAFGQRTYSGNLGNANFPPA